MGRPKKVTNKAPAENSLKNEAPAENTTLNETSKGNTLTRPVIFNGKKLKEGDKAPSEFMTWLDKAKDKNSDFVR